MRYSAWLEGGRGIVYLANVLPGAIEEQSARRLAALRQLERFCDDEGLQAFPVVVVADDVQGGVSMLLQTCALGPIRPNLAVFGWSQDGKNASDYLANLRVAQTVGMSLVVLAARDLPALTGRKRIDIWWRGQKNGGLMLLLAHLLRQNWEWKNAGVRILRVVHDEAGREPAEQALHELAETARVPASALSIVDERPFHEVLREYSRGSTCTVLGLELPEEELQHSWYGRHELLLGALDGTVLLVNSSGQEDVFA